MTLTLDGIDGVRAATGPGVLARVRYTIEIEDQERPACVVEALMLVLPAAD